MPSSPGGTCRSGSCSSRATANGYCDVHLTAKNDYKRMYDRYRADDPVRALYKCKRWRSVRLFVLRRDILCQMCGHQAADTADHIELARWLLDTLGIDAFYDPERIQGLCHDCHSVKTATESRWAGKRTT